MVVACQTGKIKQTRLPVSTVGTGTRCIDVGDGAARKVSAIRAELCSNEVVWSKK